MIKKANIQLLTSYQVDKALWDECIDKCSYGLIYARSFYLDNMHANWCCLVGKEYEWVLPITSKKKWGIAYLFQPPFVQQSGIFAIDGVTVPLQHIIEVLQHEYKFWEVDWNFATPVANLPTNIETTAATNFLVDLSTGYESISQQYHKDLQSNLKKSQRHQLTYLCTTDYKKSINFYQKHYGDRMPHVTQQDYQNFKTLCEYALKNKCLFCRQAVNDDGELLAIVLLLSDGKRLYNLMNTTTTAGRQKEANHFLLDNVIREFAGSPLWFDFEGSDLPGVQSFYKNFGPQNQPFYKIRYNQLPWPIRLLKN